MSWRKGLRSITTRKRAPIPAVAIMLGAIGINRHYDRQKQSIMQAIAGNRAKLEKAKGFEKVELEAKEATLLRKLFQNRARAAVIMARSANQWVESPVKRRKLAEWRESARKLVMAYKKYRAQETKAQSIAKTARMLKRHFPK